MQNEIIDLSMHGKRKKTTELLRKPTIVLAVSSWLNTEMLTFSFYYSTKIHHVTASAATLKYSITYTFFFLFFPAKFFWSFLFFLASARDVLFYFLKFLKVLKF